MPVRFGTCGFSQACLGSGASEVTLAPGDAILNTQSSVSLLNLLMRFGTGQ